MRSQRVAEYVSKNSVQQKISAGEGKYLLLVDVVDGIPIYLAGLNFEAAATTGASKIQGGMSGFNLEGEGMLIGVWDEGSVKNHIEFGSRIISKEVDSDESHATHVTGTLIASGVNSNARGMAPKASVTNWYFNNDIAEMTALAKPDQTSLLLSNHSYGTVTGWTKVNGEWSWSGNASVSGDEDYRFGFYGSKAQALDQLANLAPYYTIVWAAGNDRGEPGDGSRPPDCNGGTGYDCIIPESVAKNIITVGAINKLPMYSNPASVVMSNFSSWGPTDDGRIKPDLVGAGVNLFSLLADGTDSYGFSSGTSMSTPNVTGSLTLLQELYSKLHGGKFMKSATLKALAIQTAKEAGILPGPDYSFGWGLLDVEAAAKLLRAEDGVNSFIREENLVEGSTYELVLNPKANQKITITMAWNDPASEPIAPALDPLNLMLVNDLDIKLVAENGAISYPWLLDPSTPSAQAIRGDNYRDNVEKLEFNLPEAKPYRLVVSHKGFLTNGNQDFSLIVNYQSSQSLGNTFYWVNNGGNWEDDTHWSFSSGGPSALMIPDVNDRVIVDENSFDGGGPNQITLNQDRSCSTIKWLCSEVSGLNLQGNTLTVNKELAIGNTAFSPTGNGVIRCANSSSVNGNVNFVGCDLGEIHILFDDGNWSLQGDAHLDELEISKGSLAIKNSDLEIETLVANSTNSKQMTLTSSELELVEQSDMNGDNLDLTLDASKIKFINTAVELNWDNVSWSGPFEVINSEVIINGNNSIQVLSADPGSSLILGNGSNQNFERIEKLEGETGNSLNISSSTKASITLTEHFLFCTDFLNVTNVDLNGTSIIAAGINSTVTNSANWQTQSCESVLFADFDANYLCENGFAEFTDQSNGLTTTWEWDFGDEASPNNSSSLENAFHEFSRAGLFTVNLTIGNGQQSHSVSKEVEITPTTVAKNEIAVGSDELVSASLSSAYQWFLNDERIEGATSRSYNYQGAEGVYRVVTYDGQCNRTSSLATITGLRTEETRLRVYPNPADVEIVIEFNSGPTQVSVTDLLGRVVYSSQGNSKVTLPAHQLSNGIYLLKINDGVREVIKKILVSHQN